MPARVEVTSYIPAPPERVWARVTTLEAVNDELRPVLRMTAPPGARLEDAPLGRSWFRSRLLLGGRVPAGHSDLTLVAVEPGRRFLERSPMTGMRVWEHERTVEPRGTGTRVTDRLVAQTIVPLPPALVGAVVRALFHHRHRRLTAALA